VRARPTCRQWSWRSVGDPLNSRKPAEKTIGISAPPAKPWTLRHELRLLNPALVAQPAEATTNSVAITTKTPRRDNTRVNQPLSGIEMISAIR
jgi:hypothetical protein